MGTDISGAVITALIGVVISFLNYLISKQVLLKNPQKYSFTTIMRQVLQVLFLVAVYFIGQKTRFDIFYLLIGAALGITIPMFYFTGKLVKINDSVQKDKKAKEDEIDG